MSSIFLPVFRRWAMMGFRMSRHFSAGSGALFLGRRSAATRTAEPAQRKVDYATDIAPLLERHCYGCHGPKVQTSNLRLDDGSAALQGGLSGAAIKPGKSAESPLVLRISGATGVSPMPPSGARLTPRRLVWCAPGSTPVPSGREWIQHTRPRRPLQRPDCIGPFSRFAGPIACGIRREVGAKRD